MNGDLDEAMRVKLHLARFRDRTEPTVELWAAREHALRLQERVQQTIQRLAA